MIPIRLSETETTTQLYIPSQTVSNDNEVQYKESEMRNTAYDNLLKIKTGSDNFNAHPAQTFNYGPKDKSTLTRINEDNQEEQDAACQAFDFEIEEAMNQETLSYYESLQLELNKGIEKEFLDKLKNPCQLPIDLASIQANAAPQIRVPGEKGSNPDTDVSNHQSLRGNTTKISQTNRTGKQDGKDDEFNVSSDKLSTEKTGSLVSKTQTQSMAITQKTKEFTDSLNKENLHLILSDDEFKLLQSDSFKKNLIYVERILNQSVYHKQYISYRNYPEMNFKSEKEENKEKYKPAFIKKAKEKEKDEKEGEELNKESNQLQLLFKFRCDITKGRTVSSADWNWVNPDLLAATYGEIDLNVNKEGHIIFWTQKNPNYPERVIDTPSRAMCCKFSPRNPNLIGVGMYDGVVAIYDIRKSGNKPIADSRELEKKHLDVVWEVDWVGKSHNSDKGEGLVSISSDGKIMEWSIKKGLEAQDLKLLNRQANPMQKDDNSDAINFRYTTGFSLNFLDSIIYLVSTEDGTIHRCSKSYKEQYLENYYGHTGPVYKVRCNPFWNEIFLTASADWTCRVWNGKDDKGEKQVLQSLDLSDEVYDIEWSPYCSTLFVSCAKDGRLELWDLAKRSLDPIYVEWDGGSTREHDEYPARSMVKFCRENPVLATGNVDGDIGIYRLIGYEDCYDNNKNQRESLEKILGHEISTKSGLQLASALFRLNGMCFVRMSAFVGPHLPGG